MELVSQGSWFRDFILKHTNKICEINKNQNNICYGNEASYAFMSNLRRFLKILEIKKEKETKIGKVIKNGKVIKIKKKLEI